MMKMNIESISSKTAEKLLENNPVNRLIRDWHVMDLKRKIVDKEWILSPDPICIGEDGTIYNGQHRLWAIFDSGMTVKCWVCRDCKEEVLGVIDSGIARTLNDRVNIVLGKNGQDKMTTNRTAAIRGFFLLPNRNSWNRSADWTPRKIIDAWELSRTHLQFSFDNLLYKRSSGKSRLYCTSAITALARAHAWGIPVATLKGFVKVFLDGEPSEIRESEVDNYVRRVRDKLIMDVVGPIRKTGQDLYYFYIVNAIKCFDGHESPRCVRMTDVDPYPLRKEYLGVLNGVLVSPPEESFREQQGKINKQNIEETEVEKEVA